MMLPSRVLLLMTSTQKVFVSPDEQIIESKRKIIRDAAAKAGTFSGIYKMLNKTGDVIYVGKAKNLKNRLSSYMQIGAMSNKTISMIINMESIEVVITDSELEALLLESNIIKTKKPFFNVLLRDDKSFPYIVISKSEFPRIYKYRSVKYQEEGFFGPYPAVKALDETVKIIQKIFQIRVCTDQVFKNRSRPCLQYFIKRCLAPCCRKISPELYGKNVKNAALFLRGEDDLIKKDLQQDMRNYSESLDFENAAIARDRIKCISEIQSKQCIQSISFKSMDVAACSVNGQDASVHMAFFRGYKNVGRETFYIKNRLESVSESEILQTFLLQFYKDVSNPQIIVTSHEVQDSEHTSQAVHSFHGIKSSIVTGNSPKYKTLVQNCLNNARLALTTKPNDENSFCISKLEKLVGRKIGRIEVYDNSHISGSFAYGCMVVFKDGKFCKNEYRKFSISNEISNKGDDIGMMTYTISRRFSSNKIPEIPDLMIIDGGKTQLSAADKVLSCQECRDKMSIISIAKQNNRTKGDEKILLSVNEEITFDRNDELLKFLIMLRDEAHRFAITSHRKKRQKSVSGSEIDKIPFVGELRKRKLLEHFGSAKSIAGASTWDLMMVDGINRKIAQSIFNHFHGNM